MRAEALFFIICILAALAINSAGERFNISPFSSSKQEAFCSRVIDGDTIIVKSGNKKIRVRLLGIDTPEINHKNKPMSSKESMRALYFLKEKIEGKFVFLKSEEPFVDYFGRVLAYVFKDDELLNSSIVRKGYGRVFRRYPCKITPDLLSLESQAKKEKLGIWK